MHKLFTNANCLLSSTSALHYYHLACISLDFHKIDAFDQGGHIHLILGGYQCVCVNHSTQHIYHLQLLSDIYVAILYHQYAGLNRIGMFLLTFLFPSFL